jgi:hypothetical protein
MGKAIVIGTVVVILALLTVLLVVWARRLGHKERAAEKGWALKGDLNREQEQELFRQLQAAAAIFQTLTSPTNVLDDASYIQDKHRQLIVYWLNTYYSEKAS